MKKYILLLVVGILLLSIGCQKMDNSDVGEYMTIINIDDVNI